MRTLGGLVCFLSTVAFSFHIQRSYAGTKSTSYSQLLLNQSCPVSPLISLQTDTCLVKPNNCSGGYCIYSDLDFSGSRGISFLTTPEMEGIFRESIQKHKLSDRLTGIAVDAFEQRDIPGKGVGLVAKRFLQRGELIIREPPALIVHLDAESELPDSTRFEMQQAGVEALPADTKLEVLGLMGHFGGDPIEDRLDTNAFGVMLGGSEAEHRALLTQTSRLNHDCRPSCILNFNPRTLTASVYTVRDIRPGEELSISYIDTRTTYAKRHAAIQSWGFTCSCAACTLPPGDRFLSDDRIQQIKHYTAELKDWSNRSQAAPEIAEALIRLYQEEQIFYYIGDAYRLAAHTYSGVRDGYHALRMASNALVYGLQAWDDMGSSMRDVLELLENLEKHWSWGKRLEER
ncbi:hypothetical protein ASPVEDRAFT_47009 [Aspergillus versicolor CBS 583.65]|uniref:SET domain-containing protein n=1 Tax=Aspergillus versicolor CBS 583.65 TaxID=1036611 RepID=A0A1L9Q268_ASPVE|nr:uncharacterized protein ASPVEDRAFT_47009 [Aspergillus versicolor CBS 583.65]OJJ07802.1 hypothetical protein ASPVEDRAFT_47009 [Aspergillus versicolor CBS 583.65]